MSKWQKEGLASCSLVFKQKYSKNPSLKNSLLSTGTKSITEVSKADTPWGTGVALSDMKVLDESTWSSRDLMNLILTHIRKELSPQSSSTVDNSQE